MMEDVAVTALHDDRAPEVVVVGAGPTGLLAAILLVRCGVAVRILDRSTEPAQESRAFALQARSLEILGGLGLAEAILDKGQLVSGARIYVEGAEAAEIAFDDLGRADTPYSFVTTIPQSEIELILSAELRRLGGEVERGVEVTGLAQDEAGVTLQTHGPDGGATEIRCRYVIGADGAHSIVRKELGLSFEGAPYPQSFLLADCRVEGPFDPSRMSMFLGRGTFGMYFPLRGGGRGRVIATQPSGDGTVASAQGFAAATLQEVEAALRTASGDAFGLSDATWVSRYRVHHRMVGSYRRGRAFVAGDAAHIHSPAGGQGMNTGLQDSANLAWKLAAVIRGGAPDALLDTYHAERWPIGQILLRVTDRLFERLTSPSRLASGLRNLLVPTLAGAMSRFDPARRRAFRFISELGIRYHPGPHVVDAAGSGWPGAPRAGARAPDATIARRLNLFDLLAGYRFHVLAFSRGALGGGEIRKILDDLDRLTEAAGGDLRIHLIANSLVGRTDRLVRVEGGSVFAAYGVNAAVPQALFLVRPDGHVAWRRDRLDPSALALFLRERFSGG